MYTLNELPHGWPSQYICRRPVVGIDLGSRTAKGVLLTGEHLYVASTATGLYMQETAEELISKLLAQADLNRDGMRQLFLCRRETV